MTTQKLPWQGVIISVQPRIHLVRSFDQRQHEYLGFALRLHGTIDGQDREFFIGIGKATQTKQGFRVGDRVSGESVPVLRADRDSVEFYKTSKLKRLEPAPDTSAKSPPWTGITPDLPTYRQRGHRRLDARTYARRCQTCIWGCRMPVVMIIDQWNPRYREYRYETFCYGPKSCAYYKAGPRRKVPGRNDMVWEEPDWVDRDDTAMRTDDE